MAAPVLATKLYIPQPRPGVVLRHRLIERLNQGLHGKLTLISAPAGFGKSTLVSEWVADCERPVAWLSLEDRDNDPIHFLRYLVAALQTVAPGVGAGLAGALQSPQPPPIDSMVTVLLNDITTIPDSFALVLDDYHVIEAQAVDGILTFLIEHMPPQMHLVIATREDPDLPLARLRGRGQLNELRVVDLRFTMPEAAEFLNQVMDLNLTADDIAALEVRTEGWIAGLQLAAISMQGHEDTTDFIRSFTGSHHFVMDYLVEEILQQQPESVQNFLLHTSILDRMCGPLCDAVLNAPSGSGQEALAYLERVNLFLIPLDSERRWYRYHHLFAELLRQRLSQSLTASMGDAQGGINALHILASQWYEDNGMEIEAFHHAAAAHDIERAERLSDGKGIPLHFRGAVNTVLDWLGALPTSVLNARPSLWWRYGSMLLVVGQTTGVEEKLAAAEAALQGVEEDVNTRHLIGRIASARAVLALTHYDAPEMLAQSRRALEYLNPDKPGIRASANWTMGFAYLFMRDYASAKGVLMESISLAQAARDVFITILASIGLANIQESENQLYQAAETYQRILQMAGDQPLQIIHEAHQGMARILYQWNDLKAAEQYGRQSLHLARQYDRVIDRFIICEVFLACLKLAQGDVDGAAASLSETAQSARQPGFTHRIPEVAAAQVLTLLHQGKVVQAANLAQEYDLPFVQARVHLAQGDTSAALEVLETLRQQAEERNWHDDRLRIMVLQAVTLHAQGDIDEAVQRIGEALSVAEPGGYIRLFVDEGHPMARLLSEAAARGMTPDYTGRLLAVFEAEQQRADTSAALAQALIDPLSERELEVLQLTAQGLSNQEIAARLFLALSTIKGHNQRIFDKLQVQRRTEAIARARELGLI